MRLQMKNRQQMNKIIILHGALGAKIELTPLENALAQNFEVHALEFEGHGSTPLFSDFSIPNFAENLREFIEENQLHGAAIFGYSMGGYVALYLASDYPEMVGDIITLGTKFDWSPTTAMQEAKMLNPDKIEEKVPKFAAYLVTLHGADYWKIQMKNTAQLMLDLGANELLQKRLASIENRCFIGLGDSDEMVSREETLAAVEALPNADFFTLENTAHPIGKVDVGILARKINALLEAF